MSFIQHSWHLLHRTNLHIKKRCVYIYIYIHSYIIYTHYIIFIYTLYYIYTHIYIHHLSSIMYIYTEHITSEHGPVSHGTLLSLPSSLYKGIEKRLEHLCLERGSMATLGSRRNMNRNYFVVL